MSSSAQLSLLPWLLRWQPVEDGTTFAAGLHAGSSIGVGLALRPHLRRADLGRVLLTSVPAGVAGVVAQDVVEERLGRPGPTAALLAGAGVLMWLADRRPQDGSIGTREAAAASIAQVLALAPGVSRSGAALTALRLQRVPREEALRFSMLMSLPVTVGAGVLTAGRARRAPSLGPSALAAAAAYAAGRAIERSGFRVVSAAAAYRLAVAAAVARRLHESKGTV